MASRRGTTYTDIENTGGGEGQSDIMISGGAMPFGNRNYNFIEIYANAKVNSDEYKIEIQNQGNEIQTFNIPDLKEGQYLIVYDNNSNFSNAFGYSWYGSNYKTRTWNNLDAYKFDVSIAIKRRSDNSVVDAYGVAGQSGTYPDCFQRIFLRGSLINLHRVPTTLPIKSVRPSTVLPTQIQALLRWWSVVRLCPSTGLNIILSYSPPRT